MDNVEIRFRLIGDHRNWEEIPVVLIVKDARSEFGKGPSKKGKTLAMLRGSINRETVKEIRWNWAGSQQGFYID